MQHFKSNWQGGLWEQESANQPSPPPVVIPIGKIEVPVKPVETISTGAKVGFASFLTLIFALACLAIVLGVQNHQGLDLGNIPEFFGYGENITIEIDPMEGMSRMPTIQQASWDTDMTLELVSHDTTALSPQEIYAQNLPTIVFIQAQSNNKASTGTGVIMSEDGYIITNAHVIEDAYEASVTLWDNRQYEAQLVGYDFPQDLAVLKIDVDDLQPAMFGDSDALSVGEPSYALGNPLGANYRSTFTDGMVSAMNRVLKVEGNDLVLVQTTAAINSGNSGGALLNQYGEVVGITTIKIMSEQDTIEGMGLAIPSVRVKQVVDRILAEEKMEVGSVGIKVLAVTEPVQGLMVVEMLYRESNVQAAGMRTGDIIVSANSLPMNFPADLTLLKCYSFSGDPIEYVVNRNGVELTMVAELEIFE